MGELRVCVGGRGSLCPITSPSPHRPGPQFTHWGCGDDGTTSCSCRKALGPACEVHGPQRVPAACSGVLKALALLFGSSLSWGHPTAGAPRPSSLAAAEASA